MENKTHGKCPVEVYGAEVAADVLPRLYGNQPECASTHGCLRDGCLLDGVWTEEEETATADAGDPEQGEHEDTTSGWEFLGSD